MKNIWIVEISMMNGTVCILSKCDVFTTKELAEEAAEKLRELNKNTEFPVYIEVKEGTLYENREDVPILNTKENE